jgi:hypothetical protein
MVVSDSFHDAFLQIVSGHCFFIVLEVADFGWMLCVDVFQEGVRITKLKIEMKIKKNKNMF